jgi:hypothetical protein
MNVAHEQYISAKNRVFVSALSTIMDDKESFDDDNCLLKSLLAPFPDKEKMTDGHSWLPLHFALALGNKVREADVHILQSQDPLAMQRYRLKESNNCQSRYIPAHFLCMQTHPNMSLVKYLSIRDLKSFIMRVHEPYNPKGRNALELAADYSESVGLLTVLLQIDQSIIRRNRGDDTFTSVTALGFLCGRSQFCSFDEMLECLIALDSSVEVVRDGLTSCLRFYGRSNCDHQVVLALIESLFKANSSFLTAIHGYGGNIFHRACSHLEGKLGVVVISFLFSKYDDQVEALLLSTNQSGTLLIHYAAWRSTSNIVKLLIEACPESRSETHSEGDNLLRFALIPAVNSTLTDRDRAIMNAKVQYLCCHYPELLLLCNDSGYNPLNDYLYSCEKLDLETVKIMCEADKTIVTQVYMNTEEHIEHANGYTL